MKKQISLLVILLAVFFSMNLVAQEKKAASPAAKAEAAMDGVNVAINYSQPSAKGRKIMGGLVPFGEVWRTGANATTSIEFSGDVKIEGQSLPKGKYGLYTLPGEGEWVIIIIKTIDGDANKYDKANDVLRVKVKPGKTDSFVETFNIGIEKNNVVLKWENTLVSFKVSKG